MERRKEPRLNVTQSVTLLVLGSRSQLVEACVLNVSTNGVQVRSPIKLMCDTEVKIQGEDVQMLGKVRRCEAQGKAYTIAIELSKPMSSLIELELLHKALLGPEKVVEVETPSPSYEEDKPGSKSK